jgi:hypothetical protein
LAAYLVFERMTELSGAMVFPIKHCVGKTMRHNEFPRSFGSVMIKQEKPRIHEPREQIPARF